MVEVKVESVAQALVFNMTLGSAAFQPNPVPEIARLLRKYADTIEQHNALRGGKFIDINGNACGDLMVIGQTAENT